MRFLFWRRHKRPTQPLPVNISGIYDSNDTYHQLVDERVLRLRDAVEEEFGALGLQIYRSSAFLHEETINMAIAIRTAKDDEEAKARIRPLFRRWVIRE